VPAATASVITSERLRDADSDMSKRAGPLALVRCRWSSDPFSGQVPAGQQNVIKLIPSPSDASPVAAMPAKPVDRSPLQIRHHAPR